MQVTKKEVLKLMKDLGKKNATEKTSDSKLLGMLNTLPKAIDSGKVGTPKSKESQDLMLTIVENLKAGKELEIVAEKETKKKKATKGEGETAPKKRSKKESGTPSNKEIVYKEWEKKYQKKEAKEVAPTLFELVEQRVQLSTIRSWIGQWKKGNNTPACAK